MSEGSDVENGILVPNCACGVRMNLTHAPDIFVCLNCDGIQPQELQRKQRKLSVQDHEFNMEMRRREREWYPKKEEG